MKIKYKSQAAKDAQKNNYGDKVYWDYLESSAIQNSKYFKKRGEKELAERMMTRSLSEALQGNDGR